MLRQVESLGLSQGHSCTAPRRPAVSTDHANGRDDLTPRVLPVRPRADPPAIRHRPLDAARPVRRGMLEDAEVVPTVGGEAIPRGLALPHGSGLRHAALDRPKLRHDAAKGALLFTVGPRPWI